MGVKDLWNILSPLCERKPLFELQGKTIAIDLSCWVVDSQTVTDNVAQPKMYLRNLYFRTVHLLLQGIFPVFVLEGTAPSLKHGTIARRNEVRQQSNTVQRKTAGKGGRTRFNTVLRECEEMLKYLGISCIRGTGEAEAMCAYLNEAKLVDGCVSQDSDCFLYGARTVYRNFCASSQANRASGGTVDEYSMDKIEELLNLDRNKMIALALLCGCDYDNGVHGVGKEAALKLFKFIKDCDILERLKSWRRNRTLDEVEKKLSDPNNCTSCGHKGKLRVHTKSGCVECGTKTKCSDAAKETRGFLMNEIALRKKALLCPNFPNQELIDEFLIKKDKIPSTLELRWNEPDVVKFVHFMEKHVAWEPAYAFSKIFCLLTRWHILHFSKIPREDHINLNYLIVPVEIIKIRNLKSVANYEIMWNDENGIFDDLRIEFDGENCEIDDDCEPKNNVELITIEPQKAFSEAYPELVEAFEEKRNAKKKKKVGKRSRPNKASEANTDSENPKKPERKRKNVKKQDIKNRKIDEFISKEEMLLEESFRRLTITPKRSKTDSDPVEARVETDSNSKESNIDENVYSKKQKEKDIQGNARNRRKRNPQISRVLQTEKLRLNGTLERMFDELTPEDFANDLENDGDFDISEIVERLCGENTNGKNEGGFLLSGISSSPVPLKKESSGSGSSKYDLENDFLVNPINPLDKNESAKLVLREENVSTEDEFDILDQSYVPLEQRLNIKLPVNKLVDSEKYINNIHVRRKEKFSLGIDDLLDSI